MPVFSSVGIFKGIMFFPENQSPAQGSTIELFGFSPLSLCPAAPLISTAVESALEPVKGHGG